MLTYHYHSFSTAKRMHRGNGDEAELLERFRKDLPGAFEEFVSAYGDRILGFGMRVCGEREDAKDVLQETLLQAYRSLKNLQHPEALRSWLYRVAANACLMKRRKGKFEPEQELSLDELVPHGAVGHALEVPDPGSLPDEELARSETASIVRGAIADLPMHYRVVLVMRDMEQLTTKEVAQALGIAEPAVKMRLHRARLMIKQQLERGPAGGGAADGGDGGA